MRNNDGYAVYGRTCRAVQSAIRHYLRKWCEFYKYKNEMTFPKRKKSSRFQTILIKKKEKHLQLCQMSAKDTTQSLSHAYTDTCNGGAVLHTKATTAAIAGCI